MSEPRYQALLLDIDGTLVGASRQVSPRVADAVRQAAQRVPVALVSSRRHMSVAEYARSLGLDGLHIAEGGARVFNPSIGASPWLCTMLEEDARDVAIAIARQGYRLSAVDGDSHVTSADEIRLWRITALSAVGINPSQAEALVEEFRHRPTLRGTAIPMQEDVQNLRLVDFTHAEVSKGVAALKWAELTGIDPAAMIGVGDTYNDLPLLEACGLKVAMGNGTPELQARADFVAPPIEEDGVVEVIRRFILAG